MSVSKQRWKIAQANERKEWITLCTDKERFYNANEGWKKSAAVVKKEIGKYHALNEENNILQIGCALRDVIDYWSFGKKYAIDPLMSFFKATFNLSNSSDINYITGVAESLPYKNGFFDLIIMNNVLDHVQDPISVLRQMHRVLKDSGILYIVTNITPPATRIYKRIMDTIKPILHCGYWEPCHPHTFTPSRIDNLLEEHGFEIIEKGERRISYFGEPRRSLLARIALKLGVSIDWKPYRCLCRKRAIDP